MQIQSQDKAYDDINVTPMLDLAYVLLIIFIVLTTATVQGLKVNLPKASAAPSLAQQTTQAITISSEGRISLNTVPVSLQELESRLIQEKSAKGEFPVVVKGDGAAQYQGIIDVLDVLGRLQITQVGLATKPLTK
jgi:biopolymer transport protein ExbD